MNNKLHASVACVAQAHEEEGRGRTWEQITVLSSPLLLHVLISSYPKSSVKFPLSNKPSPSSKLNLFRGRKLIIFPHLY